MRIGGIGAADEFDPALADCLFRRTSANLIFLEQFFNQGRKGLGGAFLGTFRIVERDPAQLTDEFLGKFAE